MTDTEKSAFTDASLQGPNSMFEAGKEAEFLGMILKTLDIGVGILDSDMRYCLLSNSILTQLGIEEGEIKLGDPLSRMHELMLEKGLLTEEIMTRNLLSEPEQRERSKQGDGVISRLVELGDGSTHRFCRQSLDNGYTISVATNVSELVEKDHMLEASLALGRSGIWTYDFKDKSYRLSKSLYDYFGPERGERVRQTGFVNAVIEEDRHKLKDALRSLMVSNDKVEVDLRCITRVGTIRWSRTVIELVRDDRGRALRLRAFVKDTEREHQHQEELEAAKDDAIQASRAKSEFLANMSHEIRTPMNGILGMAELLSLSNISDSQREYVDVITSSAGALLRIINDILDFSKIEAGALELDPYPFDLKASLNDVASLLTTNAQQKGLELIINYAPDLPQHFIGDAGRIRQILTNLMGNAIKFTSEGHVRIDVNVDASADAQTPMVTLDVTDTGIGLPKDKLEAVFDKFTQADGSTTRLYGGTGLGLAITKRIVELMEGTVSVSSEVGVGSTFGICIPLDIDRDARIETLDIAALDRRRALIVDDIAINRTILGDQLANWGMRSDAVANGVEAVEAIKAAAETPGTAPYDVILLDYLMPGVNGRELASMLCKQKTVAVPPIVMLSSCDQSISSQELTDIGIEHYLVKPVRERRLFDTLGRVLGKIKDRAVAPVAAPTALPSPDRSMIASILADSADASLSAAASMQADPATDMSIQTIQSEPAISTPSIPAMTAHAENPSQIAPALVPHVATATAPVQAAPTAAPVPQETVQNEPMGKQEILVAEDFPLNRDVVRLMLAETAFEPVFAENGKIASDMFMADCNRFPLILMDVSMPVMDGYQATKVIRAWEAQLDHCNPIPIIALTGHALKNDRQECLDAGMDHYLTKPVKQAELVEVLEQFTDRAVDAHQVA